MCLTTTNIEGQVSDKPIEVYKVYRRTRRGMPFMTMFQNSFINIEKGGMVVAIEEDNDNYKVHGVANGTTPMDKPEYSLGEGYIHGFLDYTNVTNCFPILTPNMFKFDFKEGMSSFMDDEAIKGLWDAYIQKEIADLKYCFAVCKMEIPAGERYWIGNNGDVCAKRMKYKGLAQHTWSKSEVTELMIKEWRDVEHIEFPDIFNKILEMYKERGE